MTETTLEQPLSEKEQAKATKAEQKAQEAERKAQEKLAKAEQKAQEKIAKAEQKAQEKLAKADEKARQKAEKEARKGKGPAEAAEAPVESQPIVVRPRLELVLEPGPVKHVHWDAEAASRLRGPEPDDGEEEPEPKPLPILPDLAASREFRKVDPVEVGTAPQALDAWEPTGQSVARPAPRAPSRAKRTRRKTLRQAPRKAVAKRGPRKAKRVYPGDNHPVIDIEGIGPVYAKKLEKLGITTTGLLGIAKPGRVANKIGVPRRTVKMWQAEAELIKVRGIGPQFAEAMARAGVKGIDELKQRKAEDIAKQVAKYLRKLDVNVIGQPVTPKRVARWKRKAKPMRRVKVDKKALAVPTHGIPPPWLREGTSNRTGKAGGKSARSGTRGTRPSAKKGRKATRRSR